LALRAMEARGLIQETLRANRDYEGLSEASYVLRLTAPAATGAADAGWWTVLEQACKAQAQALPGLFDLSDPSAALRPSTSALLAAIKLVGGVPSGFSREEADAAFADPDAVGWAYQFYQEAAKARTYAKLGTGGKASSRAEIAAITQLFTEPYMVQWLLQNSLGRSYHEIYPDSQLPQSWPYYISHSEKNIVLSTEKVEHNSLLDTQHSALSTLSVLDPCVGSGHFLREAFDMLVAMYQEQFPGLKAAQISDNILERHLHGIDLDPRAAQLAALTLYLRAWELVRDEQRREKQRTPQNYQPSVIHIATTPSGIGSQALGRHLRLHPQDRILKPVLAGIFESLEQADRLGSLLQPRESLDRALVALTGNYTIPMDEDPEDGALRLSIIETAKRDPEGLRGMLMARVAASFREEAGDNEDVAAALFGREAGEGVKLLQLLERRYAIVVTNPPYMGSSNMDNVLRKFVEQHYKAGKRDLCVAFILRCLELTNPGGRVAMVTQQGWMFLRSFADLRAVPEENLAEARRKGEFTGLLRETSLEALAHLGEYAFEEAAGAFATMFILVNQKISLAHKFTAIKLIEYKSVNEKTQLLRNNSSTDIYFRVNQNSLLDLPESPIVYWISSRLFSILEQKTRVRDIATVRDGMTTGDNRRFLRFFWENPLNSARWVSYAKGGGYSKWFGFTSIFVDWRYNGANIRATTGSVIRNEVYFFQSGLTYSFIARGSMGCRLIRNAAFDPGGISIFLENKQFEKSLLVLLNCQL